MSLVPAVFCLLSLWTMALLVAGAALGDARNWLAIRTRARPLAKGELGVGSLACEVVRGDGPANALATHEATVVGRARDGEPRAISIHDVALRSVLHGGAVHAAHGDVLLEAGEPVSVWTEGAAVGAAAPDDRASVEDAYAEACSSGGLRRTLRAEVMQGARVFVVGELLRSGGALVLRAPRGATLIVAASDPRPLATRRCAGIVAFVAVELSACFACTALATSSPAFGPVSVVGAALGLTFFVAVTPLAVAVRDWCTPPSERRRERCWSQTAPAGRLEPSARKRAPLSDEAGIRTSREAGTDGAC